MREQFQNQQTTGRTQGEVIDVRSIADSDLLDIHGRIVGYENQFSQQANGAADSLLDDELQTRVGGRLISSAAKVIGLSSITDPYSPDKKSAAPETVISSLTINKLLGRLATSNSPNSPNATQTPRKEVSTTPNTNVQLSAWGLNRQRASAKRDQKQLVRQARTASTASTVGLGIGLGKQAKSRTILARFGKTRDLKKQHARGEITSAEYVIGKMETKAEVITVPVRAERRDRGRERRGALYNLGRANNIVETGLGRKQYDATMDRLHGAARELNTLRDERPMIEAEVRRRAKLLEDDMSVAMTPINTADEKIVGNNNADTDPPREFPLTTPETQKNTETSPEPTDLRQVALKYVGGVFRKDEPNVAFARMSKESIVDGMERAMKRQLSDQEKIMAEEHFRRLQIEGIVSDTYIPGQGYEVLKTSEEIAAIRAADSQAKAEDARSSDNDTSRS